MKVDTLRDTMFRLGKSSVSSLSQDKESAGFLLKESLLKLSSLKQPEASPQSLWPGLRSTDSSIHGWLVLKLSHELAQGWAWSTRLEPQHSGSGCQVDLCEFEGQPDPTEF